MNLDSTLLSLRSQLSTRRENESQIMWPTRAYVSQSGKPGTHKPSLSWFIITSSDYPGTFYLHGPVGLHRWQHPTPLGLRFVRIFISLGLGTKRLCPTRGQKRGFFVRGAKQRPSSLPAFFQSISHLEICAISFCITEEKSEMPEISCMAFCLFLYFSKQVVLLFNFANPQVVSAEIPQSWWGSYGFTVLAVSFLNQWVLDGVEWYIRWFNMRFRKHGSFSLGSPKSPDHLLGSLGNGHQASEGHKNVSEGCGTIDTFSQY